MSLAKNAPWKTATRYEKSFIVKSGTTIYAGALVGLETDGYVYNWADATGATLQFLGYAKNKVVGDGTLEVHVVCGGDVLKTVAVTGASAQANVGDVVYATDENTLTLSAPAGSHEIGWVSRWYSSTTCDVQLFSDSEYRAWNAA